MNPEGKVAVITDSGSSIRPENKEAQLYQVTILPLELKFFENGQYVPYSDFEISPAEFYQRIRNSQRLPQTSGAISGLVYETCLRLSEITNRIISIHITSKHSVAYSSALTGADLAQKEKPELLVEVIDSKTVSLGTWFLVELAARLSQEGASLEEIKQEVLKTIPKIQLLATLATFENVIKGGRVPSLAGHLSDILQVKPILGFVDGEVTQLGLARTIQKAKKELIARVQREKTITKLAIIHTNDQQSALEIQERLAEFYSNKIPIYDAGPVLGVHGGEGVVGIIFQRA